MNGTEDVWFDLETAVMLPGENVERIESGNTYPTREAAIEAARHELQRNRWALTVRVRLIGKFYMGTVWP